jgi:hypothetical protein
MIGIDLHVVAQLEKVISIVWYGLESKVVIGMQVHVVVQLGEVISIV